MEEPIGSSDAIGGPAAEADDVPVSPSEMAGGVVGPVGADAGYIKGGEVKTCSMTSHEKNKSSPNW
jgi:hypothetical protein